MRRSLPCCDIVFDRQVANCYRLCSRINYGIKCGHDLRLKRMTCIPFRTELTSQTFSWCVVHLQILCLANIPFVRKLAIGLSTTHQQEGRDMIKVKKPQCIGCEHNIYYTGQQETLSCDTTFQFGCRYCCCGKKPRQFRSADPKTLVPIWCPKRNNPPELYIYGFKDYNCKLTYYLMSRDKCANFAPLAYRYAVRYRGHSHIDAYDFWRQHITKTVFDIYGFNLYAGEILEIDDGLMPTFFYQGKVALTPILFDRAIARQNQLEEQPN